MIVGHEGQRALVQKSHGGLFFAENGLGQGAGPLQPTPPFSHLSHGDILDFRTALKSGAERKRWDVHLRGILFMLIICVTTGASSSSASAWWQFAANGPNGERQTSPHYGTLKECEKALKLTESRLAKKYPSLYPLVGSCEEYR